MLQKNIQGLKRSTCLCLSLSFIFFSGASQADDDDLPKLLHSTLKHGSKLYVKDKKDDYRLCSFKALDTGKSKKMKGHGLIMENLGQIEDINNSKFKGDGNRAKVATEGFENAQGKSPVNLALANANLFHKEQSTEESKGFQFELPLELTAGGAYGGAKAAATGGVKPSYSQSKTRGTREEIGNQLKEKGSASLEPGQNEEVVFVTKTGVNTIPFVSRLMLTGEISLSYKKSSFFSRKEREFVPVLDVVKMYFTKNNTQDNYYKVSSSTNYKEKVNKYFSYNPQFKELFDKTEVKEEPSLVYYTIKAREYYFKYRKNKDFYIIDENKNRVIYLENGIYEEPSTRTKMIFQTR